MKTHIRSFVLAVLILAVAPGVRSDAASIFWQTPSLITADTDVSTTGTLLYAFTLGNAGVLAATVNGVTFDAFAAPDNVSSAVTVGSVTLAPQSGDQFFSDNTGAGSTASPFSDLTTAYKGLLQSGVSTNNSQAIITLTLGGLTNGNSYQVQLWANESSSFFNPVGFDAKTILTAGNSATLDSNNLNAIGGVGQWVTGTFTAAATTQAITISTGNPSVVRVINGFQVRTVPEPASAVLLLFGAALCLRRRTLRTHERSA